MSDLRSALERLARAADEMDGEFGGERLDELRDAREAALAVLASHPVSSPSPEARLAAFVKRYNAQSVSVGYDVHAPPFEDPWDMAWRRRYTDGALSDWRETVASSFAGLVASAEEIEAENDTREPQFASPEAPSALEHFRSIGPFPSSVLICAEPPERAPSPVQGEAPESDFGKPCPCGAPPYKWHKETPACRFAVQGAETGKEPTT